MALTTTTSLSQEVQDAIAAEMLIAVDDQYMFYAHGPIDRKDSEARAPGTNVMIFDRPTLPTGTYTESSRRLTEGTAIPSTSLAIAETQVSLTIREYAGPHDGSAINPFGITEFLKNRAKHNVVATIGEFMRRDRQRFLDQTTLDLLLAATTVQTPDGSASATIAQGVRASTDWLRAWNKVMKDLKIPTFPNGRWRLAISTKDEAELKQDPDYKTAMAYLATSNPLFSGHVASIEGFDIMVSTLIATTAVGVGSAVTGYQSAAWGPYGIGHGIATDPSIRQADDTDFGRQQRIIWKSEEAFGSLYADLLVRGLTS